jgi:hypothetical protein
MIRSVDAMIPLLERIESMIRYNTILIIAVIAGTLPASAQDIGVPACDAFYKSYEACVMTKMPEAQRATFKQQIDAAKNAMRQAATNAATKPQLEQSCTVQKQQLSQALASFGCQWD